MTLVNGVEALRNLLGFYYLATPYSKWLGGLDDAADHAAALAGRLLLEGVVVYSPIVHSHAVARQARLDPLDHAIWLPADKLMFGSAAGMIVAMLPGWRDSYGVAEEIKWARAAGKPLMWMETESLTWSRA